MLVRSDILFTVRKWFPYQMLPLTQCGSSRATVYTARGRLLCLTGAGAPCPPFPSPYAQTSQARCYLGPYLTKKN